MKFWRHADLPYQTAVTMIGVKPGQSVAVLGAGDGHLAAALGCVTGLNGRTVAVDRADGAAERVSRAAAAAGALVDFEDAPLNLLPLDSGAFDVAVLTSGFGAIDPGAGAVLSEAVRVLRPGGRLVVVEALGRAGLFGLSPRVRAASDPEVLKGRLTAAGLRAARVLADVDDRRYFEAAKPRTADAGLPGTPELQNPNDRG